MLSTDGNNGATPLGSKNNLTNHSEKGASMYDTQDMILPEGFDPNVEEQPEDLEPTGNSEVTTPTTEETIPETNPSEEQTDGTATTEPTTTTETEPEEVPPQTIKVTYNSEERELSVDEARTYAQKGMNYDKIANRAKEQGEKLSRFEASAKLFGFDSAEAMMEQAEKNFVDTKVKDLVEAGNTEAMARFLVQQEMQANKPKSEHVKVEEENALSDSVKRELDDFSRAYPNITKIPDEVFKLHSQGINLTAAYGIYSKQQEQAQALEKATTESKNAQRELAILQQNQAAAAKGPVTGTVGKASPEKDDETQDPFLAGFISACN